MGSTSELSPERSCSKPLGIRTLESIKGAPLSFKTHQAIILIITFVVYTSYHATRKTTSIVKSTFDSQSPDLGLKFLSLRATNLSDTTQTRKFSWVLGDGWAPFNGADGTALLGESG